MIHFFRDILDGPVYIIVVILSILAIMGIIGFIMERFKKAEDEDIAVKTVDSPKPEKVGTLVISSTSPNTNAQTNTQEKLVEKNPANLEKTEVLEIVSTPQVKAKENLEKPEGLELNLNKQPTQTVQPIPQVQVTASAEKQEALTINSADVQVKEVTGKAGSQTPGDSKKPAPVIDFGSTKDVKVNSE